MSGQSADDSSKSPPIPVHGDQAGAPAAPQTDMMVSDEMQAWLGKLKDEDRRLTRRNIILQGAMFAGLILLLTAILGVHRATVGRYAVISDVEITQHPVDPGRLLIKFKVISPGKVYCSRTSGNVKAELIDRFTEPCEVERPWAWTYEPGKDIEVELWYRSGFMRRTVTETFPTPKRADIVILIDTTGSMDPSIEELKKKCGIFSERLSKQKIEHRFALIGFGDRKEGRWLDKHEFTGDVEKFGDHVASLKRFDGGDFPESALDAVEEALSMNLDSDAIRRFYLVTDAAYKEPTRSTGKKAEDVAADLEKRKVMLWVFSKPEFEDDYEKLLGETGRFWEIENFGDVLSQGRILED